MSTEAAARPGLGARFLGGAAWSVAGAVAARGSGLLAAVWVARLLGPEAFGRYAVVQNTVLTLGLVAGAGLGMTATRHLAAYRDREPERAGRVLALAWWTAGGSAVAFALVTALFAPLLAAGLFGEAALATPLRLGAAVLFFSALHGIQTGILAGLEAFRAIARSALVAGLAGLPLPALGAGLAGVEGALAGLAAASALHCLASGLAVRRARQAAGLPARAAGAWREAAVLWRFTVPAALAALAVAPATWAANVWLVRQPGGFLELAHLAAAQHWQTLILYVPGTVAPLMLSLLTRAHAEGSGYKPLVGLSLVLNGGVAGAIALAAAVASPWIMGLYGPGFTAAWPVLALLAACAVVQALAGVGGQVLASQGGMWRAVGLNAAWATAFGLLVVTGACGPGALGLAKALFAAYIGHGLLTAAVLTLGRRSGTVS